jgi:hypothetical protein
MKTLLVGVLLIGLAVGGIVGFCIGITVGHARVETVIVEKPVPQKTADPVSSPQMDIAGRLEEAKVSKARLDAKGLAELSRIYRLNNDSYPPDIASLTKQDPGGSAALTTKDKTIDPWGKPYQIRIEEDEIVVFTTHNNEIISSK